MAVALVPVPIWQNVVNHNIHPTNDVNTATQWQTRHTMNQSVINNITLKLPTSST